MIIWPNYLNLKRKDIAGKNFIFDNDILHAERESNLLLCAIVYHSDINSSNIMWKRIGL